MKTTGPGALKYNKKFRRKNQQAGLDYLFAFVFPVNLTFFAYKVGKEKCIR